MANATPSEYASPSRRDYYEMAVPKPTAASYTVYDYRTSTYTDPQLFSHPIQPVTGTTSDEGPPAFSTRITEETV